MVQCYLEESLNHFSKPITYSHSGLSLLLEFLGQKIRELYCKLLFVLWSSEIRNSESKSELTENHETWLESMGQERRQWDVP